MMLALALAVSCAHEACCGVQVTVGRPPEGTDELQMVLSEWNVDDLSEIAPAAIAEACSRNTSPLSCTRDHVDEMMAWD